MAAPARTKRRVVHALFTYRDQAGGEAVAFRGDDIEVLAADLERGDKFGALAAPGAELEPAGDLVAYPLDGAKSEQDAWVRAAKVDEVIAAVNRDPGIAQSVLDAEERRGDQTRTTLVASLTTFIASNV